jgi:phosphoribosyl 1,2-cyclic phosphate phosphodiesterase
MSLAITILGCGSSGGVPRVGMGWGACDPAEPRNRRRRCSILVEKGHGDLRTSILIDTSPDLREQLLDAGVARLDAVLFTHDHADHTHGIDDLRGLVMHNRRRIPIHADAETLATLRHRFAYCFETPPGSAYPPILEANRIDLAQPLSIGGLGGVIEAEPFDMVHGPTPAVGFRFGNIAYAPDVSEMPEASQAKLRGLDLLILDALRYTPHPTHFSVAEALEFVAIVKPRRTVLTNMHSDIDYATISRQLPAGVEAAFDGMRLVA